VLVVFNCWTAKLLSLKYSLGLISSSFTALFFLAPSSCGAALSAFLAFSLAFSSAFCRLFCSLEKK
jgi:hypothetical protein